MELTEPGLRVKNAEKCSNPRGHQGKKCDQRYL